MLTSSVQTAVRIVTEPIAGESNALYYYHSACVEFVCVVAAAAAAAAANRIFVGVDFGAQSLSPSHSVFFYLAITLAPHTVAFHPNRSVLGAECVVSVCVYR